MKMALLLRSSSFQQQKDFQETAPEQRTIARAMMPLLTWEKKIIKIKFAKEKE